MAGPTLEELKKRQQQRRLQQKEKSNNGQLKRKREPHKPPLSLQNGSTNLDTYFAKASNGNGLTKARTAPQSTSFVAPAVGSRTTATMLKRTISVVGSGSPFAATPRDPKSNPFDIIEHAMSASQQASRQQDQEEEEQQHVVVVGDAQFSDSDSDEVLPDYAWEAGDEYRFPGSDDDELGMNENDPSLYRLPSLARADPKSIHTDGQQKVTKSATSDGMFGEDTAMQVDCDNAKVNRNAGADSITLRNATDKRLGAVQGIAQKEKKRVEQLVFFKPPESLSLRTQLSITSERPLLGLDQLKDEGTLLSHTSLCKRSLGADLISPLDRLADSLLYWEATCAELTSIDTVVGRVATTKTPMQLMHQALTSLFTLQQEAPSMYPFVYLCAREFTVVFQMVARKEMSRHSSSRRNKPADMQPTEPQEKSKQRYVRVAVVSQSYMGLRRTLHTKRIKFTLPVAPKVKHDWGELVDYSDLDVQKEGDQDQHFLHTSSFDKTWRSALLIMDDADVAALFDHLKSGATVLHNVRLYSPAPFLNATMRCAALRFSDVITYNETSNNKERLEEGLGDRRPQATTIYKLDVSGIVFPSAWSAILKSVADILCDRNSDGVDDAQGFCVSAKELSDTAHLNLLVSKQGSSVAGKKTVTYLPSTRKFMYK
ncbi:hypothetical protein IW140_003819 [Coemansia sp. RSA 1813]|nr:hypothetical protein EV178_004540 [Coemansia sp. RSA 1646]KAJ1769741.1 hypothetical protein LPJ74_003766 [Coemansia sp. RSA 1843]KAJ2090094.1 hypothetical protein IW138_002904 [Coemansia sp. RSA 986]KAJ2568501.1 hypothetical protein IW140_003819 [Coemansia sp. RSA 1813]